MRLNKKYGDICICVGENLEGHYKEIEGQLGIEVLPEIEVLPDEETEKETEVLPDESPWNVPGPKVSPTPKAFSLL